MFKVHYCHLMVTIWNALFSGRILNSNVGICPNSEVVVSSCACCSSAVHWQKSWYRTHRLSRSKYKITKMLKSQLKYFLFCLNYFTLLSLNKIQKFVALLFSFYLILKNICAFVCVYKVWTKNSNLSIRWTELYYTTAKWVHLLTQSIKSTWHYWQSHHSTEFVWKTKFPSILMYVLSTWAENHITFMQ